MRSSTLLPGLVMEVLCDYCIDNTFQGVRLDNQIRILKVYHSAATHNIISTNPISLDPVNQMHWPPLILLTELYSQALLTMGDDEFFNETGAARNPLSLDDLRRFSKQLLNIAVTLYWREEYTASGKQLITPDLMCPWETVRDQITRCLVAIHARE